jgi:acetyltransferase-like isoleucine patch superfamily enzyme
VTGERTSATGHGNGTVTVAPRPARQTNGIRQELMRLVLNALRVVLGKGFIKMNFHRLSQLASASAVLRVLGASVGANTHIPADICLDNIAGYSCHNLTIGSNVYIGPRCFFDLTSRILIEDDAAISAQVSFVTHLDVGDQPLKEKMPRREGPITVKRGAWVGVNSTILHDVTIGEFAMVGAMSLVNRSIPREARAFGIPCKVQDI